jgi:hypothetical protein
MPTLELLAMPPGSIASEPLAPLAPLDLRLAGMMLLTNANLVVPPAYSLLATLAWCLGMLAVARATSRRAAARRAAGDAAHPLFAHPRRYTYTVLAACVVASCVAMEHLTATYNVAIGLFAAAALLLSYAPARRPALAAGFAALIGAVAVVHFNTALPAGAMRLTWSYGAQSAVGAVALLLSFA